MITRQESIKTNQLRIEDFRRYLDVFAKREFLSSLIKRTVIQDNNADLHNEKYMILNENQPPILVRPKSAILSSYLPGTMKNNKLSRA